MAFLETPIFPDDIAYGSKGGPGYKTDVVTLASGREKRNIGWSQARHNYDVSYGIRDQASLDALLTFFHSVAGRANGFRFKDFADFHTASPSGYGDAGAPATTPTKDDQVLGTGDAVETVFQLTKTYTTGALSTIRDISKPVSGTVLIAVNGALQTETTHYTIDYSTGLVTFVTAPPDTELVTWGGQFHVPCRFGSDEMVTDLSHYIHGSVSVDLIEIRI